MHVNVHLAIGAMIAFVLVPLVPVHVPFLWAVGIILAGCVNDADFIFSRFEKNKNHRMFFTHSAFPGMFVVMAGLVISFVAMPGSILGWFLILSGCNLTMHVLVDSIDWGVNFLFKKQVVGKRLLLQGRTPDEYYAYSTRFPSPRGLYFKQYYTNSIMRFIEIISCCMLVIISILAWDIVASEHWWVFLAYPSLLAFHLAEYKVMSRENRGVTAR